MTMWFSPAFSVRAAVVGVLVGASSVAVPVASEVVQAASFVVTNSDDDGVGSFRNAVAEANANAGLDEITFDVTGEIDLLSTVKITDSVTITGPGVDELTIGRSNDGITLESVGAEAVTITDLELASQNDIVFVATEGTDLTVSRTNFVLDDSPAGIQVVDFDGAINITEVALTANGAGGGIAIYIAHGPSTMSTLTDLTVNGLAGGAYLVGPTTEQVTIDRLTTSGTSVAGVYALGGLDLRISNAVIDGQAGFGVLLGSPPGFANTFDMSDTTISGVPRGVVLGGSIDATIANSAITDLLPDGNEPIGVTAEDFDAALTLDGVTISDFDGRAFAVEGTAGTVTMRNSTISGLSTDETRLIEVSDSDLAIEHSTISANAVNVAGGGAGVVVHLEDSTLAADHSIFTGNGVVGLADFAGVVTPPVVIWSVIPEGAAFGGTNQESDDPGLEPLADNGGPTLTMRPTPTSPAIDNGDPAIVDPPPFDQRGVDRVFGGVIDIGAVEYNGGVLSAASIGGGETDLTIEVTVSRTGGTDGAASVTATTADGTAIAGADYISVSEDLSWAAGDASDRTFDVQVVPDQLVEGDETFQIVLSDAVGAEVDQASIDVLLIDDVDELITSTAPRRIADTRTTGSTIDDLSEGTGKLEPGEEIEVQVTGRLDDGQPIVPGDAIGAVVNVTAVQAEGVGFVTVHQCVSPRPLTSSLNYTPSANLGNELIAGLSEVGSLCIYSSAAMHVTVDLVGYIAPNSPLQSMTPGRFLDTRPAGETIDGESILGAKTTAGETVRLTVGDRGEVPDGAAAVIANVTAIGATDVGFVTVSACAFPTPNASSLNYVPGVNRGNELTVSLDNAGQMCLFTSSPVHLAVDVVGWIPAGTELADVDPARLLDTRAAGITIDGDHQGVGKLAAEDEYRLSVADRGGVAADADTVIVNVTAVAPESPGFVTVHACLDERPLASSLNFGAGVNGGNEIVAGLSDVGELCLYSSAAVHLTVDVVAYLG